MTAFRRRAVIAGAGCTIGALFLVFSCAESPVEVTDQVLYGQWSNRAGAIFRFDSDRTFTARHLENSGVQSFGCEGIADIDSGRWAFLVPSGGGAHAPDATADRGFSISVEGGGSCPLEFTSTGDPGAPTLCLVADADQSCSSTEEFHRDDA
ncbi:hypothetical protein [Streptomyces sp. NPDC026673]|uniref:hypothetical protein n=1 Tax=Streptomyces sp. NPDC026673 TaxID=3155724 RepID=UPI003400C5D0